MAPSSHQVLRGKSHQHLLRFCESMLTFRLGYLQSFLAMVPSNWSVALLLVSWLGIPSFHSIVCKKDCVSIRYWISTQLFRFSFRPWYWLSNWPSFQALKPSLVLQRSDVPQCQICRVLYSGVNDVVVLMSMWALNIANIRLFACSGFDIVDDIRSPIIDDKYQALLVLGLSYHH